MNAMEAMMVSILQKMTGLSPDQMQLLASQAIGLLQSLDSRLQIIENNTNEIIAKLNGDMPVVIDAKIEDKSNVTGTEN